ncbi:DNA-binding protein [Methylobacterium sp. E-025]|uniref:DNA-binding protein n=1 Tax=Methylobacterium sp. E-025 TaxID=2836561 RepID=UPI0028BE5676|nr:DNA-binding protein [Methylobacterium sp. E-025]
MRNWPIQKRTLRLRPNPAAHHVSAPACKRTLFYIPLSGWDHLSTVRLLVDDCNKERAVPLLSEDPRENLRAADRIRAEGKERVLLRPVWERVKLNAGVAGNNQCVGKHLAKWTRERAYSPVIEFAGLPGAVETGLAKAGVALWKAAEAEAAAIVVRERLRMAEAIAAERELRHEALGMVDARDAVIEASGTRLRGSRTSSNGRRSTSRR